MKIWAALILISCFFSSFSQATPSTAKKPTYQHLPSPPAPTSTTGTTTTNSSTSTSSTTTPTPITGNAVTAPSTGISFDDVSTSFAKACGEDKQKNCPGFREEKAKEIDCLDNNSSKLSPTCKKFLGDFKQGRQALLTELAPCSDVMKRYCSFVSPFKPADLIVCLRLNIRRLAPQCQTILEKYKNVN